MKNIFAFVAVLIGSSLAQAQHTGLVALNSAKGLLTHLEYYADKGATPNLEAWQALSETSSKMEVQFKNTFSEWNISKTQSTGVMPTWFLQELEKISNDIEARPSDPRELKKIHHGLTRALSLLLETVRDIIASGTEAPETLSELKLWEVYATVRKTSQTCSDFLH